MEKEVLIHVRGLQMLDEDGRQEPIEIVVPGQYYFRNGSHYLRYEEIMDETAEPTVNYVKLSDSGMEVRKKGLVNVHMVFERGKKNTAFYTTPFGTVQMGIAATGLEVEESEENLGVRVNYSLDMNDEYVAECYLEMQIQPKTASGFSLLWSRARHRTVPCLARLALHSREDMHIPKDRILHMVIDGVGVGFQLAVGNVRQGLIRKVVRDHDGDLLDPGGFGRTKLRAVVRCEKPGEWFREVRELRESAQRAERPFVVGLVGGIQKKDDADRAFHEFTDRQLGGGRFVVPETPGVVVLAGLPHEQQISGQPFEADILRVVPKRRPDAGHGAFVGKKDLAFGGFEERLLRDGQPLLQRQITVRGSGLCHKEFLRPEDAVPVSADGGEGRPGKTFVLFGKLCVGPFQLKSTSPVHHVFSGQKEAEAGCEIMVL